MHLLTDALAIALLVSVVFIIFNFSQGNQKETASLSFSWGPDKQRIMNGTFRLEISMNFAGDNMTMVIKANDDDYDEYDYVGLVFDMDGNGIDLGDESYGLYANNLTGPTILTAYGFLGWAQVRPTRGPQNVTFSPDTGYTFVLQLASLNFLRRGFNNDLHVCFHDDSYACAAAHSDGVYTRFAFYLPTEN